MTVNKRIFDNIEKEVQKKITGQSYMINRILIGLLTDGHVLIEGVPGLAKTLTVKCIAECIQAEFSRVQFTPDLLPADITGTMLYHQGEFKVSQGPLFAHIVLADEINRSPAKVQSALLEAMEEKQVTLGDHSYPLPVPFLVLATQNPLEQEGTYPLPEAQLDRFMFKIKVGYPSESEEIQILKNKIMGAGHIRTEPVAELKDLEEAKEEVRKIHIDDKILDYIVRLVNTTRHSEKIKELSGYISYGASPRASIHFVTASRAVAYLAGRENVLPDDVKEISKDILRHRIGLTYQAMADNLSPDNVIEILLKNVPTP